MGPDDLALRKSSHPTRRSKRKQTDIPDIFQPSPEAQELIDGGGPLPLMLEISEKYPTENPYLDACSEYIMRAARSMCLDCELYTCSPLVGRSNQNAPPLVKLPLAQGTFSV